MSQAEANEEVTDNSNIFTNAAQESSIFVAIRVCKGGPLAEKFPSVIKLITDQLDDNEAEHKSGFILAVVPIESVEKYDKMKSDISTNERLICDEYVRLLVEKEQEKDKEKENAKKRQKEEVDTKQGELNEEGSQSKNKKKKKKKKKKKDKIVWAYTMGDMIVLDEPLKCTTKARHEFRALEERFLFQLMQDKNISQALFNSMKRVCTTALNDKVYQLMLEGKKKHALRGSKFKILCQNEDVKCRVRYNYRCSARILTIYFYSITQITLHYKSGMY